MATALVTGGTSGIGAQFARQLAARGFDLVLVARDEERLDAVAAELHAASGIHVETLRADLGDRSDVDRVARRIEDPDRPIDVVINNAGFGVHQGFTEGDPAVHDHAFEVMCRAVLVLSSAAARAMVPRGSGTILNVSSLQTYLATGSYAAIKAWVTAFTQGLAVELHGTGVTVTALLPGWVSTEWHARAGVRTSSIPDWLWTEPDVVVRLALRDVDRGRVISIPTVRYRVLGWFARHLPRFTVRWISRRLTARRRAPGPQSVGSEHPVVDRKDD
ncbi:SDR family NAD(P)-dependent oxidoreductase [Salinibacterium soli]|uniref:SDR family oxidoreductase n=1 Tax=Antiquaquibacter soli TaxID=3064523 RepID=A0ABT9BR34_9MICO|nr:SDR family oxidoreductase [Protaetiibacter sp. WY-16]MDO7882251.1 SDR family oxidoreductase [Protaetiibacter sp. WY-16]